MILALALAATLQAAPVEEADIVVIAQRLARLSVIVNWDPRGRMTCGLDQSSGNARLDAQLCRTAARCVREGARENAAVRACIDRRKPALLADLRRQLGAARGR